MDDNDWDLYAVVRGCSPAAAAEDGVSDPFSSFSSPLPVVKEETRGGGKKEICLFLDPMATSTASRYELEELCKPVYIKPPLQQLQPLLVQKPSYASSSPAASVFPAVATVPYQLQQQPRQPHRRPVSQTPRSKRRKNQQKKVVCQVPADGVSSDMWAWRKYGQKPIKGSPYPRGYYRCSSSKGCQARKQVERSRADPGMLVITYTAEHNHPVPTHRNSLSGSTRQKLPPPNSSVEAQPPPASGDGEQLLSPSCHPSSPAGAPRLSPTTPLTDSIENELFQRRSFKGDDEKEEDEEDEELLTVGDVEMMGEDEMLFLGMEVIDGRSTTTKISAKVSASSSFFDEDNSFEEHFFRSPYWLANNNAAAAAGGS